jgi:DNA polymerase I-like protein with 3'-5' exonuclease and polymerase domains
MRGLLADAAVPKTGHDLKRQAVALATLGVELAGGSFDTMLAAYLLEAGERNLGLAEVATRHGVAPSWPPGATSGASGATLTAAPATCLKSLTTLGTGRTPWWPSTAPGAGLTRTSC